MTHISAKGRLTPMRSRASALCVLTALAAPVHADSFDWHGYVDFRAIGSAQQQDWTDGGLGKTRFGGGGATASTGGAFAASVQLGPQWLASGTLQVMPQQRHPVDILDASIRYRPVSTTPWRWSVRMGAFFPPISLENGNIGWTSPWTLTPSAVNTWVGEELRVVGTEVRIERRADTSTLALFGSLFGRNDPAGELLATRGWGMGDLTSGLNASLREPDSVAPLVGTTPPVLYRPFVEIDHRIGWYAGADWDAPAYGKVSLLRYDNRADPTREQDYAGREVYAWHTRFWSLATQSQVGNVVLAAQAMHGATAFEPAPGLLLDTQFNAGYLLLAWGQGAWQPAVRLDLFQTRQLPEWLPDPLSEHGNAATIALNWRPRQHVRVTGELLRVDSTRNQRRLDGASPRQIDTQLQVNVRLQY